MTKPFSPHEYQALATQFLLATPKAALYADMGMGKTGACFSVLDKMMHAGYDEPILVLAPLRVARETWRREAAKWTDFSGYSISPIVGDTAARHRAVATRANIHTCNYDQLVWLVDRVGPNKWPWRTIIADESTKLKGMRTKGQGGKRTNALALVARMAKRWINLSGTPAPNGLKDLWGQYWFLDQGERLGRTYTGFKERWFKPKPSGYGIMPLPHAEKEIHERIDDITMALRAKDWFDVHEPKVNEVVVTLPKPLRQKYDEFERDMFMRIAETPIEAFNSGALTNKCMQFANGAVYTKAPEWLPVHELKLEALESIVNESGGKALLVAYNFQSDKERILKRFPQARDLTVNKHFQAFLRGEVEIGVAHPASMGHGLDGMQEHCWTAVYFGYTWKLDDHQQILERIGPVRQLQSGHKDRVVEIYNIICEDTLDEVVLDRHKSKCSVQDALTAAMARRHL